MAIRVLGLNSRIASIEVRELFSFDAGAVEETLGDWQARYPNIEAAFVSTCNRTELYVASERNELPDNNTVFPFLVPPRRRSDALAVEFERYSNNFQSFSGFDAAKHLFSVASSLDSMILGEPQILSQMKRAYETSVRMNTTGPILNNAFQTAFKTAKRVSVETEIFRRRVSIPSVAVVDFALNIFERLSDKKTLVLGAGEMAEETLKYLADFGAKSIVVKIGLGDGMNATVNYVLKSLLHDARFDCRIVSDMGHNELSHYDAVVMCLFGKDSWTPELKAFAANGGKVVFVADTAEKRRVAAEFDGAIIVESCDKVIDVL